MSYPFTIFSNWYKDISFKSLLKYSFDASGIDTFLAAGYVKGVDHFTYNNKAYIIMKSFIDLNEKFVVVVAVESTNGCDIDPVEE